MVTGYADPVSFVLREVSQNKVACPRCGEPMNYEKDQPVFCNSCPWPEGWKKVKGNGKVGD